VSKPATFGVPKGSQNKKRKKELFWDCPNQLKTFLDRSTGRSFTISRIRKNVRKEEESDDFALML